MKLRSRLWLLLSQSVNTLMLSGDPDESVSARAFREGWQAKVDRWLGEGHCKAVYEAHKQRELKRTIE